MTRRYQRQAALAIVRAHYGPDGKATLRGVELAARAAGVSVRQIYRWLSALTDDVTGVDGTSTPRGWQPNEQALAVVAATRTLKEAHAAVREIDPHPGQRPPQGAREAAARRLQRPPHRAGRGRRRVRHLGHPRMSSTGAFAILHAHAHRGFPLDVRTVNRVDEGRIALRARVGIRRAASLARDILSCLGVDFDVTGAGRNADQDFQLLSVLLVARGVADLLVDQAQELTEQVAAELALLCAGAGVRLWLVTHPPTRAVLDDLLADWAA